jgi:hypothetical protein
MPAPFEPATPRDRLGFAQLSFHAETPARRPSTPIERLARAPTLAGAEYRRIDQTHTLIAGPNQGPSRSLAASNPPHGRQPAAYTSSLKTAQRRALVDRGEMLVLR